MGGLSFLKRTGREPCELTARADAALARLLAGMVIDEVEPMARRQGGPAREKAIAIVAVEFLAKTASSNPSVANVGFRLLCCDDSFNFYWFLPLLT